MVFAVWAGQRQSLTNAAAQAFVASYSWGREHIEEMVKQASAERGFPSDLAREYFTRYIAYQLTPKHLEGLALFRKLVRKLDASIHNVAHGTATGSRAGGSGPPTADYRVD